jgi:signal transduction histidine kinase
LFQAFSRIREELQKPGIDVRISVYGQQKRLLPEIQYEVYRIGREALVNAFSHSRAKRVELELEYSTNVLHMRIHDNGCGFDPEVLNKGGNGHWGLVGMRERGSRIGGRVRIWSSPTAGTDVRLSIPGYLAFQS